MITKRVTISGTIAGEIWMPGATCGKTFAASNDEYPHNAGTIDGVSVPATLRDMVLHVTNDGDFQSCSIIDATVTFERTERTRTGIVTRSRHMDIRQFPSVADCVVALESDKYWAGVDCFSEGADD